MLYLARATVVFDGPLTIKFLNPPVKVRLPLPRDTCTEFKIKGSKCSMPKSGIPEEIHSKLIIYIFCPRMQFFAQSSLPFASIGNIPSNICRKQSSSFGFDLLHCRNQSAEKIVFFL